MIIVLSYNIDMNDPVNSENGIHYEDISANLEGEDIDESQYEGVSAEVSVRYTYIIYIVGLDNMILYFSESGKMMIIIIIINIYIYTYIYIYIL
jgi:hypothetical protein